MQIAIYFFSALLTNFVFSVVTTMLVVFGIEKTGGDPGTPIIMLFSLMCICGLLSILTATAMGMAKSKNQKEFPARFSAAIFLFTYLPFHVIGIYFPDERLDSLPIPSVVMQFFAILFVIMLFFSYIPFFHVTAQGLINLNAFVKRRELAGNRYPKFFILAFLGAIVLFTGWLISKPETQPSPNVSSLQDNWGLLETGGRDWQSDAYLNDIVFDVNKSMPYKISAIYLSKSTPDEMYSIDINEKGKIYNTETRETYPMRESAKLPIRREDWVVGSAQAWGLFLKDKTISTCATLRDKHVTIYMRLERIVSGRLAWVLYLGDCPDEGVLLSFYLDAKTGETIESYLQ
jgi:hypothetical protein